MLVTVALDADVTDITYGTQSLSRITSTGTGRPSVEIWGLVNPVSGTANVVINTSVAGSIKAGVTTFAGVNPTTPIRNSVTGSGTGNSSLAIGSATGDLVYDVVGYNNNPAITAGGGQTVRWNVTGSSNMTGASSTKAGAASVTTTWNVSCI